MRQISIGNGCGFWGDNIDAPLQLVNSGRLDYLTLEYLAELTMSILGIIKQKRPDAGYATDFLKVLEEIAPKLSEQPNLKVITNAGGMNPIACANQAKIILAHHGLGDLKLAAVFGDDLMPEIDRLIQQGNEFRHMDTDEPIASVMDRLVSANIYMGSEGIVEALSQGARVVVTGRVADAALTLAPAVHEFGWYWADWNLLAAGATAGHLIECGAQVTGGLWPNLDDNIPMADIGYPIAVIREDGQFEITKPEQTGGVVNRETVAEQLMYEVGDPANYYTPDVVADFTSPILTGTGKDRIQVSGCTGTVRPHRLKVSAAYRHGWSCAGTLVISGPHAMQKAEKSGRLILEKLSNVGLKFENALIELLGGGDLLPGVLPRSEPSEVVLRVAVRDGSQSAVNRFSREFAPLVTSGYIGTTGYTGGRPPVREVFAFWPTTIDRQLVKSKLEIL